MERAAAIADAALASRCCPCWPRRASDRARRLAPALDHAMRGLGAEDRAFETIVASGPNAAKPHARPGPRTIVAGDPVVVDFGATFDGYRSDMTRTFCVGGEPDRRAGPGLRGGGRIPARRGGARCAPAWRPATVDKVCRDVIAAAGWAEAFEHGTGHGVGLDIHEAPSVGPGRLLSSRPASWSPSSRACTWPASVGSASRTPWWSPTTAADRSPVPEGNRCLMAVTTNDLRNGMTLDLPEGLFSVVEFQHVKPGKGGAFVRTKLKNVRTGAVIERTFRADEQLEQAIIDKREMQYLYRDGTDYVFMDNVVLRPGARCARGARRRRPVPQRGRQRRPADVRRRDRGRGPAGRGGADGGRDRARRAGRPGVRRPQAGHRWRPGWCSRCRCS